MEVDEPKGDDAVTKKKKIKRKSEEPDTSKATTEETEDGAGPKKKNKKIKTKETSSDIVDAEITAKVFYSSKILVLKGKKIQ